VAVEALLRWRLPDIGVVPPLEVVAAAEELGCVEELDTRVLRRACRQLARWRREGHDLTVAVNVSPRHLTTDLLPLIVEDALSRNGLLPGHLTVEVAARDLPDGVASTGLAALRDLGVRVALDHFGTGSLGLAQLPHLPVALVKVDRSLFAGEAPLIDLVVTLGGRFGFDVAAVGVESDGELSTLFEAGCLVGQGNLLGAPAHGERVEAFLEEYRMPRL
jgi:EAL domain-containing protein (putative c-di-GMP-specific phosphodiesterase class I)